MRIKVKVCRDASAGLSMSVLVGVQSLCSVLFRRDWSDVHVQLGVSAKQRRLHKRRE